MPSPFPGMDPYLEGYLWPDVHHRLATQISDQLMPMSRPRYVARIEILWAGIGHNGGTISLLQKEERATWYES